MHTTTVIYKPLIPMHMKYYNSITHIDTAAFCYSYCMDHYSQPLSYTSDMYPTNFGYHINNYKLCITYNNTLPYFISTCTCFAHTIITDYQCHLNTYSITTIHKLPLYLHLLTFFLQPSTHCITCTLTYAQTGHVYYRHLASHLKP